MALIDGEHYPPVVVDALVQLGSRFEFLAAVFLGGSEKIGGGGGDDGPEGTAREVYGLPVHFASDGDIVGVLGQVIDMYRPETIVDVSDEPVVGYRERFRLVSHALARNVSYEGSDFRFSPPKLENLATSPSLSIIGTAKRVGKTALSGFAARTIQEDLSRAGGIRTLDGGRGGVVIVPMGRGGPAAPEVIDGAGGALDAGDLLAWSRAGRHAASDHFEDAALSRVTTVGCRRCGGGMAGAPFVSNVAEGARVANSLGPSLTIFEGSGAAIPPVATDARLLVVGAHQPLDYVAGYLGTYRVLLSDAVVVTMAEQPLAEVEQVRRMVAEIESIKQGIPVIPVVFRPQPLGDVAGRKVALFSTAPSVQEGLLRRHLEETYGCRVVAFSANLSDRGRLRDDLAKAETHSAEVFLTEIKAAAIDVVAEEAEARGVQTVFMDNIPVEVEPSRRGEMAELCRELARLAVDRFEGR
ncbi:MAG TPA: 2,3-diphosphoglycerate synthetase [Thermoleophilia bacterium]|nr:2,3-diphosphoglycerate synthetase [Thermoleophilia bacterium]